MLSVIFHVAKAIFHPARAIRKRQTPPVSCFFRIHNCLRHVGRFRIVSLDSLMFEIESQIAQRLIRILAVWRTRQDRPHQILRRANPSFPNQLTHLRQILPGIGINAILFPAIPDALLIHLDPLVFNISKHHGADPPVSEGQCLLPHLCRLAIPQFSHAYPSPYFLITLPGSYLPSSCFSASASQAFVFFLLLSFCFLNSASCFYNPCFKACHPLFSRHLPSCLPHYNILYKKIPRNP